MPFVKVSDENNACYWMIKILPVDFLMRYSWIYWVLIRVVAKEYCVELIWLGWLLSSIDPHNWVSLELFLFT